MHTKRRPVPRLPTRIRIGRRQYSIDVVETMLNRGDMARHYPEIGRAHV